MCSAGLVDWAGSPKVRNTHCTDKFCHKEKHEDHQADSKDNYSIHCLDTYHVESVSLVWLSIEKKKEKKKTLKNIPSPPKG